MTAEEREKLYLRLDSAVGERYCSGQSDEQLIDGFFALCQRATKHTIAHVMSEHGHQITELMKLPYARMKDD